MHLSRSVEIWLHDREVVPITTRQLVGTTRLDPSIPLPNILHTCALFHCVLNQPLNHGLHDRQVISGA
jgi:hypothetical protein